MIKKQFSIEEYAQSGLYEGKKVSRQYIWNLITTGKPLPKGVTATRIGKQYIITVK